MTENIGKIKQVLGAVVDVSFDEKLPQILDALVVKHENKDLVLMGGYNQGQNSEIDSALNNWPKICDLIKQNYKIKSNFEDSIKNLMKIN